jgi:hypothetical protein
VLNENSGYASLFHKYYKEVSGGWVCVWCGVCVWCVLMQYKYIFKKLEIIALYFLCYLEMTHSGLAMTHSRMFISNLFDFAVDFFLCTK